MFRSLVKQWCSDKVWNALVVWCVFEERQYFPFSRIFWRSDGMNELVILLLCWRHFSVMLYITWTCIEDRLFEIFVWALRCRSNKYPRKRYLLMLRSSLTDSAKKSKQQSKIRYKRLRFLCTLPKSILFYVCSSESKAQFFILEYAVWEISQIMVNCVIFRMSVLSFIREIDWSLQGKDKKKNND